MTDVFKVLTPAKNINGEHTHVSMGDTKGTWYLSSDKSQEFYNVYGLALKNGQKLSLAEKPGEYVPLLVDIDLKKEVNGYPNYGSNDFYNDEDIINVVKIFQNAVSENVNRHVKKLTNKNLRCVVLEKDIFIERINESEDKYIVKKGIHLHFPHLFLPKKDIKISFMPVVKTMIDQENVFQDFINSIDNQIMPSSLIDDISSKYWLMYGSSKEGLNKPYKISKILDHNQQEISISKCFKSETCIDGSPITDTNVEFELPMLLSINPKPSIISNKLFYFKEAPIKLCDALLPVVNNNREKEGRMSAREIEKMKKLTSFLSVSRADDYNQWWTVGITLFNIGTGRDCEDEALEAWKMFSSQSTKYDESRCDLEWAEMKKKNKPLNARTMGSLIFMAKSDNPVALEKYLLAEQMNIENWTSHQNLDVESIKKLKVPVFDTEIAEMFVSQHEDEYLNGNMGWFKFNGTIWSSLESVGRHMRPSLVSLSRSYLNLIPALKYITKTLQNDDEGYEPSDSGFGFDDDDSASTSGGKTTAKITKLVNSKIKLINDLAKKCQNNGPQMSLMKVIEDMIGIDNLNDKMDQNKQLIAFTNGVYDLSLFTFRQGLPEDYITRQMTIPYDITLTMENPKVIKMLNFFKKIFPDEELFEYFMLENCEMYIGGNRDKILQIWTGEGDNGKSVTNKIIENKFGKLSVKFPKGMVTGDPPKAGACFPELTRAQRGVRWAVVDEFAPDETVNAGVIKNLTGGIDNLYARDIQQKGKDVIDIDPFFKLIFICNTIPNIRNPDNATWNRIRVIPFESTFKDNIDDISLEEQKRDKIFLKDTSFCEKETIRELGEAFAWYLIQVFIKKEQARRDARLNGKSFKIKIPAKVNEATELYKAQGNAIADYFNDKFEISDDDNDTINIKLYYQDFLLWFSQTHSNKNVNIDKKKFMKLFVQHAKGDMNTFICKKLKLKETLEEFNLENDEENGMPLF